MSSSSSQPHPKVLLLHPRLPAAGSAGLQVSISWLSTPVMLNPDCWVGLLKKQKTRHKSDSKPIRSESQGWCPGSVFFKSSQVLLVCSQGENYPSTAHLLISSSAGAYWTSLLWPTGSWSELNQLSSLTSSLTAPVLSGNGTRISDIAQARNLADLFDLFPLLLSHLHPFHLPAKHAISSLLPAKAGLLTYLPVGLSRPPSTSPPPLS